MNKGKGETPSFLFFSTLFFGPSVLKRKVSFWFSFSLSTLCRPSRSRLNRRRFFFFFSLSAPVFLRALSALLACSSHGQGRPLGPQGGA